MAKDNGVLTYVIAMVAGASVANRYQGSTLEKLAVGLGEGFTVVKGPKIAESLISQSKEDPVGMLTGTVLGYVGYKGGKALPQAMKQLLTAVNEKYRKE